MTPAEQPSDEAPVPPQRDHRALALQGIRPRVADIHTAWGPDDRDIALATVHALIDIGDQLRRNAPVPLEPLFATPMLAAVQVYPGPCPAARTGPLSTTAVLCTLRAGHEGDHEHDDKTDPCACGISARWGNAKDSTVLDSPDHLGIPVRLANGQVETIRELLVSMYNQARHDANDHAAGRPVFGSPEDAEKHPQFRQPDGSSFTRAGIPLDELHAGWPPYAEAGPHLAAGPASTQELP